MENTKQAAKKSECKSSSLVSGLEDSRELTESEERFVRALLRAMVARDVAAQNQQVLPEPRAEAC